ncbi:MAG: hypothetical protein VYD07_08150, partial [Pseudomonadota bacterium]|nr:hypothetical protein [Pseudomonadota bacterium]
MIYKFVILILLFLNYSFWSLDIGDLGLATSLGLLFFILFWFKKFNKKRYRYNKLLDLESFFVTFFYVFHYGYISLYILGFSDYDKEVFYDKEALLNALYFCNLCILAFCFSYALFFKKNRLQQTDSLSSERYETLLNCKKISIYILTLAVVMFWLPILTSFSEVLASYKFLINIGQNSSIGKLFWLAQYLGYISIALYLSVTIGEKSPRRSKPESLVLYFFIFGFLLIGDRGGFLSFFMMVALASVFSQRKRSIKGVYF